MASRPPCVLDRRGALGARWIGWNASSPSCTRCVKKCLTLPGYNVRFYSPNCFTVDRHEGASRLPGCTGLCA